MTGQPRTGKGLKLLTLAFAAALWLGGGLLAAEPLDQHGKAHSWKGNGSAYTVIDFAADWCAPCWKVLPKLQQLADRFPSVSFLVVSVDEKESGRDHLVEQLGLQLPVLWDESYVIAEHYEPEGMPATFVIDPEGTVVYQHTGSKESAWRELAQFVERIAREPAPSESGDPPNHQPISR